MNEHGAEVWAADEALGHGQLLRLCIHVIDFCWLVVLVVFEAADEMVINKEKLLRQVALAETKVLGLDVPVDKASFVKACKNLHQL